MKNELPPTSRSLPLALIRAREWVIAPIRDMLAETGITEQQWRVLRVLSEQGSMDSKTLANRACLLFPSLTRIAANMREKGLLTQTRDPRDQRRQMIDISAAGQKIIDDHACQSVQIVENIRNDLGPENYETLLDLLAKLDAGAKR